MFNQILNKVTKHNFTISILIYSYEFVQFHVLYGVWLIVVSANDFLKLVALKSATEKRKPASYPFNAIVTSNVKPHKR